MTIRDQPPGLPTAPLCPRPSRWRLALALCTAVTCVVASSAEGQVRFRDRESVTAEEDRARESILGESVEVFRLDCRNEYLRREISLFGDGVIRVREGLLEAPEMWLGELDLGTTEALIARLQEPDLSETPQASRTVVGDWVETCLYTLDLPGRERQVFEFRRLDALPLPLQKSLSVAITSLGMVDRTVPSNTRQRLPRDYVPRVGDVLVGRDDRRFRISGFTTGNVGIELTGVDQPVVLFITIPDIPDLFISVAERGPEP